MQGTGCSRSEAVSAANAGFTGVQAGRLCSREHPVPSIGFKWYYLLFMANNIKTVFLLGLLTGIILFIGSFWGNKG